MTNINLLYVSHWGTILREFFRSNEYKPKPVTWVRIAPIETIKILLTSLLTPFSRVLLEKLIGSAASQEILRIFGTQRFLTVLTSASHMSLS